MLNYVSLVCLKRCKYWHYPEILPTASVVIVFFNEAWSVIVRTVHSAINTSPKHLMREVILVDDGSTYDTSKNLTEYIKRWRGKVKLIINPHRMGLIKARIIGAQHVSSDVIVILDAHCECVTNWLPPLLAEISNNRRTMAIPIVDGLDWRTFQHRSIYGEQPYRGIWEWGFLYKETPVSKREYSRWDHITRPYWSPTHAGGLLAIDAGWFRELGMYDEGIKIWGGEQYELSFKVWLCGGNVKWVPCSRVAHVYRGPRRKYFPFPHAQNHQTDRNHLRLSEVWMDEYKKYFRIREPATVQLDFGDVSDQISLRNRLNCTSFDWFMKNVAYDMFRKFPLPSENVAWGECKNIGANVCLDQLGAGFGDVIGVYTCHNQLFRLNAKGEISSGEHCFHSRSDGTVRKKFCLDNEGIWNPVGEWMYDNVTLKLTSKVTGKCLEASQSSLQMKKCVGGKKDQMWTWKNFYYN
ncbi:hypothetical protein ACOME3_002010 [Neoechinorhynchus agilis]